MRKAARILSVMVVAMVAIGVVATMGWFVHAQSTPPIESGGETPGTIEEKETQAESLAEAGQHEAAAVLYEEISLQSGDTIDGQRRAVEAGKQYALANQPAIAIQMYDRAIQINLPEWKQPALYERIVACEQANMPSEALLTIDRLKVECPESSAVIDALDVKARIENLTADQLEDLKNKEREATEILNQARHIVYELKDGYANALPIIGQVQLDYTDTSAAYSALLLKGEVLHIYNNAEGAYDVYDELLKLVEPIAPNSELAKKAWDSRSFELLRTADWMVSRIRCYEVIGTPAMFETIRTTCNRVIEMDSNMGRVARARSNLVIAEMYEGNLPYAEQLGEQFLSQHYSDPEALAKVPQWIMEFKVLIGEVARRQGNYEKALQLDEEAKTLYEQLPDEVKQQKSVLRQLEAAYFQKYFVLHIQRGLDSWATISAGQEFIARFPNSKKADYIRRVLGLPLEATS